ncbi:uncharacterized protein SETTUDRAFT_165993 [Exserohilum turcica Et28A]|uniref:DUF7730 domain-containing protein n=1 Tax=Exserohilum turcicum (strain 28A) TaxID=671987 RepID=R0I7P9_EXST2|nr:uncharacterized protein SETTUDRAFT_165993 [Exserohilum turcica Et28A]EOA81575.1 hypothetical protein SETTUDRAFT_165993 [Exserohilum turcica Et28A]
MVKKVTYSRRKPDKRRFPFDFDDAQENDNGRKRAKANDKSAGLQSPTPASSGHVKRSSVSKNGAFGGPVSIPEDADVDPAPHSGKRRSVFDKVLGEGRCQAPKPDEDSLRANKQQFAEILKIGQRSKEANDRNRKRYLPTPPAETQKAPQEDEAVVRLNGYADKSKSMPPEPSATTSSQTPQPLEQALRNEPPREPYQPRAYKAVQTAAPRRIIDGCPLSRKSCEAQKWSTNQASSPLLQLPPNVRELIYKYTLGGKTININYETYRIALDPTRPKVPRRVTPMFRYHCTVIDGKMNPFLAAAKPYIKTQNSFTLLNSTCRQLYVETASLPYKLNVICFGSHNIMVNFLLMEKRLSRQQLDAFTQLLLPDNLPGPAMLASLRNLEKVYLIYQQTETAQGWYHVDRKEGEEPSLRPILKGRGS